MNTPNYTPAVTARCVTYKTLSVSGLNIAYREAGNPANPKLVLLHGFPSSSHQYRSLIPSLADRFHVIRSEEHTSELQSHSDLVCRLLLEKKKTILIQWT